MKKKTVYIVAVLNIRLIPSSQDRHGKKVFT